MLLPLAHHGLLGSDDAFQCGRRLALLAAAASTAIGSGSASPGVDTNITDRVFLDIGICEDGRRPSCSDPQPLGRLVIGLYGKQVPGTCNMFKAMCTGAAGSSYQGTVFHKVLKGRYIKAGHQGPKEKGNVPPPTNLMDRNLDSVSSKAFLLPHTRPGTISLCLADNDDDDIYRLDPDYHNVEFLITTGPGPVPELDNGNIVFGTVLEGLPVVAAIADVQTNKPPARTRELNRFAEDVFKNERAAIARSSWDRPLSPVMISRCGELA